MGYLPGLEVLKHVPNRLVVFSRSKLLGVDIVSVRENDIEQSGVFYQICHARYMWSNPPVGAARLKIY